MQKFKKGDWVKVADNFDSKTNRYTETAEAIVISGDNRYGYTLHFKGKGEISWYDACQLTMIEPGRLDKLAKWKAEEKAEQKQKSDIDWIFSHGEEVLKNPHGASIQTLVKCLGITNLWGSRGEGFTYIANVLKIIQIAEPFLKSGDKESWVSRCDELKA